MTSRKQASTAGATGELSQGLYQSGLSSPTSGSTLPGTARQEASASCIVSPSRGGTIALSLTPLEFLDRVKIVSKVPWLRVFAADEPLP